MNLNNLEDRKEEMKVLGFSSKLIEQMEEKMKQGLPDFKLHESVPATKGQVDLTLHFRQSSQSDYYYLNRYEAVHNQARPLEEGQKYMVITKGENDKNIYKNLENLGEALDFFKKQSGTSELAVGKDAAHKTMLANMENGTVNFVAKDFQRNYYSQPLPQTFWIDRGKGFNKEQGVNLVQGRYVHRDDLLSREGVPYKAWMQLDTEKPRDRQNNLTFRQYADPAYRFDLNSVLKTFNIKELDDPKKAEVLEASLRNGNRPLITTAKDGEQVKMFIETAVRWGKINFYAENGRPEKREQFLKEPALRQENSFSKALDQNKNQSESQQLSR